MSQLPVESRSFEDVSLLAAFDTLNSLDILNSLVALETSVPRKFTILYKTGLFGRVYGEVSSEAGNIHAALQLIKDNVQIPILTYMVSLREAKKQIFTLKKEADKEMNTR